MGEQNRIVRISMPHRLRASIAPIAPFDLELSFAAMASFAPRAGSGAAAARAVLRLGARPLLAEFRQELRRPPRVTVTAHAPAAARGRLRAAAASLLSADLDLRPFYRLAARDPVLGALTHALRGLKPLRPASLFEMAVIAITEQQISLAAAYRIRQRLIERFGANLGPLWAFPSPRSLARAPLRVLRACGLSRAKSGYIAELARKIARGALDLDSLRAMPDEEARDFLRAQRGFGPWSADYVLVRGLGRVDRVPADDLGVRDAVGQYLGGGRRVSARTVERLLKPFAPYRGLAVFYLLVAHRLDVRRQRPIGSGAKLAQAPKPLL